MCGIVGIRALGGTPVDEHAVREMERLVLHRGPDAGGSWSMPWNPSPSLETFDHRSELTPSNLWPVTGPSVIFNGEIFNYRELRHELATTRFGRTAIPKFC